MLTQLTSMVHAHKEAIHCSYAVTRGEEDIYVLAVSGVHETKIGQKARDVLPEAAIRAIEEAFLRKQSFYGSSYLTIYFQSKVGRENVIYVDSHKPLTEWERYMVDIYCSNVSVAFDNIYLNEELESTQREIIYTLGEITETRSMETGYHVKRVAEYSRLLALKYGLTE